MAVRRLVAQPDGRNQILKMDNAKRFIQCYGKGWQFLFGPNSALSNNQQIIKIAAEFNKQTYDGIYLTAYLFGQQQGTIDSANTCTFDVYSVNGSGWTETLINTVSGTVGPNSYFSASLPAASLFGVDLDGEDTVMIQATIVRLGNVYRDRIYLNHAGIVDSLNRVKQRVDFLSITKLDE